MEINECKRAVLDCLLLSDVHWHDLTDDVIEEISMTELTGDSISFVMFIIALEERLQMQLPDELLLLDHGISLGDFCLKVSELI